MKTLTILAVLCGLALLPLVVTSEPTGDGHDDERLLRHRQVDDAPPLHDADAFVADDYPDATLDEKENRRFLDIFKHYFPPSTSKPTSVEPIRTAPPGPTPPEIPAPAPKVAWTDPPNVIKRLFPKPSSGTPIFVAPGDPTPPPAPAPKGAWTDPPNVIKRQFFASPKPTTSAPVSVGAPRQPPTPSPTKSPTSAPTKIPTPSPTAAPIPTTPTAAPVPTAPTTLPIPTAPTAAPVPTTPTTVPVPTPPTTVPTPTAPTAAPVPTAPTTGAPVSVGTPEPPPTPSPTKSPTSAPPSAPIANAMPDPNDIVYGLQPSCNSVDSTGYNICLDLVSLSRSKERWMDAFGKAKQRWESIIVGDQSDRQSTRLPDLTGLETVCTGLPSTIDDLYICGRESIIDGPRGVLGSSGPVIVRTGEPKVRTIIARMKFDTDDIRLQSDEEFDNVVLHEMAHALGYGTLWERNGLYINGSGRYANGTGADAEWKSIGCSGPLPVELDGEPDAGTRDSHWDEKCLVDELMTGALKGAGKRPISRITIGSMEDMGYVVDYSQADAFTINDLGVCGSFCPEVGTRKLRTGEGRVKLSSDDMDIIKRYAKSELDPLMAAATLQDISDNGKVVNYAINVLYQDAAGQLHDVFVTHDDVKD